MRPRPLALLLPFLAACSTEAAYVYDFAPNAPLTRIGAAPFRIGHPAFALTPDGTTMVYVGGDETSTRLYRRTLTSSAATPLEGTDGGYSPFISPDGRRVAFFAGDRLKHVALDGGDVVDLTLVHQPFGGTWRDDETILYVDHECIQLRAIPSDGGASRLVDDDAGCWPHVLPGGRVVLFGRWDGGILAVNLETGERTMLDVGAPLVVGIPRYQPTGHLLYTTEGQLQAVPFDAERLEVTGTPTTIATDLRTEALTNAAHYAIAPNGDLLYVPGQHQGIGQFVWVTEEGTEASLEIPPATFGEYRLSPDGTKLAYAVPENGWRMRVHDLETGTDTALETAGGAYSPAWTPDGQSVVFRVETDTGWEHVRAAADGSTVTPLGFVGQFAFPQFFAADGRLFTARPGEANLGDIITVRLEAGQVGNAIVATPANEWGAVPSPDGRLIAYMKDEFGRYDVFVRAISGGEPVRVSTGGGMDPLWSTDGRTLYFQDVRRAMSARIEARPSLRAGETNVLFEGPWVDIGGHGWDRASDGRFLMVREIDDSSAPVALRALSDWSARLRN